MLGDVVGGLATDSIRQTYDQMPVRLGIDSSIRAKIIDTCGMACTFCHNEGTPVAGAYIGDIETPNLRYRGGRVSIYEKTNGVSFLPGIMKPNQAFVESLQLLQSSLNLDELHLTGGEPTLHKELPALIKLASDLGYKVKLTSNGENGLSTIRSCAESGLSKINFSIFGTTPDELASIQSEKYSNPKLAKIKLEALHSSIEEAISCGIETEANVVVSNESHIDRVIRIINQHSDRLSIRLLNDLGSGFESISAIHSLLDRLNARPKELYLEAGSSGSRVRYELPGGQDIYFKQIRRVTLPRTCSDCTLNNEEDCEEGFYGVRLYIDSAGEYKVGVCIQRMDLTANVKDFIESDIPQEVDSLRKNEYALLSEIYKERLEDSV